MYDSSSHEIWPWAEYILLTMIRGWTLPSWQLCHARPNFPRCAAPPCPQNRANLAPRLRFIPIFRAAFTFRFDLSI